MRLTNETWQERLRDLESEIYHRFVDHMSKQVKKLIDHPLLQSLSCTGISPYVSLNCEFFNQALKRSKSYNVWLKTDTFEILKTLNKRVLRTSKLFFCCFESYLSPGFLSSSFRPSLKEIITSPVSTSTTSGLVPYLHSYMTNSYGRVLGFHFTLK